MAIFSRKHTFRWLHAVVAIFGLAVCGLLVSANKGHPPGIVFLPLAVAAWLVIHLFIGLTQAFAYKGRQRAQALGSDAQKWPVVLVLIVFACSALFLYGSGGLFEWWRSNEAWRPFRNRHLLVVVTAFVCLTGILLRRQWGRFATASASILIAGFFAYRLILRLLDARSLSVGLVMYAIAFIIGFALLGVYLLRSERIKSFFK